MGIFGKKEKKKSVSETQETTLEISKTVTVIPEDEGNSKFNNLMSYHIAALQGIGARGQQEDSFAFSNSTDVNKIINKGLLAIVADGMGGMSGGKLASETAVSTIRNCFNVFNYDLDLSSQLSQSFIEATNIVYNKLKGAGGSTAIACVFFEEKLYFASVGDSPLYLKRGNQLYRLNREHNVYTDACFEEAKQGDLSKLTENDVNEAVALTQFIGMDELNDIDRLYKPLKLRVGDVVLMCSDGVETISDDIILDCLNEKTPKDMCSKIESEILSVNKKYQDNYTALVIRCE